MIFFLSYFVSLIIKAIFAQNYRFCFGCPVTLFNWFACSVNPHAPAVCKDKSVELELRYQACVSSKSGVLDWLRVSSAFPNEISNSVEICFLIKVMVEGVSQG